MEKVKRVLAKIENNIVLGAIQSGLVLTIPAILIGSFCTLFSNIPITSYQSFLVNNDTGIFLKEILTILENITTGFFSVYVTIAIAYMLQSSISSNKNPLFGASTVSFACFLLAINPFSENFQKEAYGVAGVFIAIVNAILITYLYSAIVSKTSKVRFFTDGASPLFERAINLSFPIVTTILLVAAFDLTICEITGEESIYVFFYHVQENIFGHIGNSALACFIYLFFSQLLWCFGIHGSKALYMVNQTILDPMLRENINAVENGLEAVNMFPKPFVDTFSLLGGCGSTLCLVVAILLVSKRKGNRTLAKASLLPMIFNINEIMTFGLPIILNPIMLIPFMIVPLMGMLIGYIATVSGFLPIIATQVDWTTPIFVSGYLATGTIRGSLVQLLIFVLGVLIYIPFLKMYEEQKERASVQNMKKLQEIYCEAERNNDEVYLTTLPGVTGEVARQLVNDLKFAVKKKELYMLYQPQINADGYVFGAEALLRWNHRSYGFIYPPIIIKLAYEAGFLEELEAIVFSMVKKDDEYFGNLKISVNVSPITLYSENFIDYLIKEFPGGRTDHANICVEITERARLNRNGRAPAILSKLKENGFMLAIDDFSMGTTSITYLQQGKFDIVKFDGALTRNILTDNTAAEIVSAIARMAENIGFVTLAEYVETKEEADKLASLGCKDYQGYYFSKPVSNKEFNEYWHKNNDK